MIATQTPDAVKAMPAMLGGMMITAIPDLARPIMVYGLTSTFRDGWRPFVTHLATARLAAREVRLAGTALDMVLNTRNLAVADLFDDFQRGSAFERVLESGSARFGVISLMAPWNATMKQITGVMVMSNVLRATKAVVDGKASPKQIERLAASGIGEDMARRIWGQFQSTDTATPRAAARIRPSAPKFDEVEWSLSLAREKPKAVPESGEVEISRASLQPYGTGADTQAGMKTVSIGGEVVSKADLIVSPGMVTIQKIETLPAARRKGYALKLVDDIFEEFPGHTIRTSLRTEDGSRFFRESFGAAQGEELQRRAVSPSVPPRPRGEIRDGVFLPNTEDWTDKGATDAFRTALVRDVDRIIITPGVERPLWTSKTWGRLLGQFKSFAFSSVQRTLLAGLQQRDAALINGVLISAGLGAMAFYAKSYFAGDKSFAAAQKANVATWTWEAIDNSGVIGVMSDANNILEKFTRGRVGASYFTGSMTRRYQSRSDIGALLGPTYDLAADAMNVTGSGFAAAIDDPRNPGKGGWTESSTRSARKLLPFQNLFWLRRTFDHIEKTVNAKIGVPRQAEPVTR